MTQSPGNAAPLSTYAVGPLYRALPPSVSPNRWMPAIATVLSNTLASTWEVTPSVARTMNFSFIVDFLCLAKCRVVDLFILCLVLLCVYFPNINA